MPDLQHPDSVCIPCEACQDDDAVFRFPEPAFGWQNVCEPCDAIISNGLQRLTDVVKKKLTLEGLVHLVARLEGGK